MSSNPVLDIATAIRGVGGQPSKAAANLVSAVKASATTGKTKFWATDKDKARIALAVAMEKHVYFYGPSGTGKSTTVRALLENSGLPYYRFQGYEGFTSDDWYGSATIDEGGKIAINYSSMVKAVEEGCPVIVEELNLILPVNMGPLFSFLDDTDWVDVTVAGKTRRVIKKKGFRMYVTANDNGSGDQLHLYGGGQVLNRAVASRFSAYVKVGYLPPELEMDMIVEKTSLAEKALVEGLVFVANETRKIASSEPAKAEIAIPPRNLLAWASAYLVNDEAKAGLTHQEIAELTIIGNLPDSLQSTVRTLVQNKLSSAKINNLTRKV